MKWVWPNEILQADAGPGMGGGMGGMGGLFDDPEIATLLQVSGFLLMNLFFCRTD